MSSEYNAEYEHMPAIKFDNPPISTLKDYIEQINRRVARLEAIERQREAERRAKAALS